MSWSEAGPIARQLYERNPHRDPLTLRFPDLEQEARTLPALAAAARPTPAELEAIQIALFALFSNALAGRPS